MKYKLSIDEEKVKKYLLPETLGEKQNEDETGSEENKQEKESRGELDYYINQLDSYHGKTIDEIVRDKFQTEKQELDTTTDDELYKQAKEFADSFKAEKQTKLQNTASSNTYKLQDDAKKVQEKAEKKQQAIENQYDKSVSESKNSAIKNGIGRSSIIENLLLKHQDDRQERTTENSTSTQKELDALNKKIKNIEDNLAVALSNLDMETAVVLNDELSSLKSSRDKANLAANRYNTWVEERIQQYKKELLNSDEGKAIIDYIERGKGDLFANAKIALTKYIDGLPVDDAIEEIQKEEYSRLFGKATVESLLDYLKEKKG